jgi:8-oxo-dGTP diphosphatase
VSELLTQDTSRPLWILEGNDFGLAVWVMKSSSGSPVNPAVSEHDAISWVKATDLEGLSLAHPLYAELRRDLLAPLDHKTEARP